MLYRSPSLASSSRKLIEVSSAAGGKNESSCHGTLRCLLEVKKMRVAKKKGKQQKQKIKELNDLRMRSLALTERARENSIVLSDDCIAIVLGRLFAGDECKSAFFLLCFFFLIILTSVAI